MKRMIHIIIINIILIGLCSCSSNNIESDEKYDVEDEIIETIYTDDDEKYEIIKTIYSDNDENINRYINIAYPQVTELENKYIECVINDKIRETALEPLKIYPLLEYVDIHSEYSVTRVSNDILSMYFAAYIEHAPPDSLTFYVRNNNSASILISTGEKIRLSDVVNINEDFFDPFYDNFHLYGEYESDEIAKRIVDEDVKSTFALDNLMLSDQDNFTEVCSYFTEDSLFISITVRKSAGSYALYEAKYSDIEEFLNPRFKMLVEK